MNQLFEITGHIAKNPTKKGDIIILNVPMKPWDTLRINGWDITLPENIKENDPYSQSTNERKTV